MSMFSDPWVARARGLGPVRGMAQGPIKVTVVPARSPLAAAPVTMPRAVPATAPPRLAAPAAPPPAPPAAAPMPQGQQPIPMGNKASCPVCRSFGG